MLVESKPYLCKICSGHISDAPKRDEYIPRALLDRRCIPPSHPLYTPLECGMKDYIEAKDRRKGEHKDGSTQ